MIKYPLHPGKQREWLDHESLAFALLDKEIKGGLWGGMKKNAFSRRVLLTYIEWRDLITSLWSPYTKNLRYIYFVLNLKLEIWK